MSGDDKTIWDYDPISPPARSDNVLLQANSVANYKRATLAEILGTMLSSDVPDLSATYALVASLTGYLDKTTYDTNDDGVLDDASIPAFPESNVYYVGKHGDNTKDGKSARNAFLTFTAAMAVAVSGDSIVCLDGGTYAEGITAKDGVNIHAPNATLDVTGSQLVMSEAVIEFNKITRASGGNAMVLFDAASGRQKLTCTILDDYGAGIALRFSAPSVPIVRCKEIYVRGGGIGIADFTGAIHYHLEEIVDIYLDSAGAIGLQQNVAGNSGIATVQHIVEINGPHASTIGVQVNAGVLHLMCHEISADTSWDVASGAVLNILGCTVTGTKSGTGTVNSFVADEPIADNQLPSGIATPGSYNNASVTIDTYGRVTSASDGVLSGRNTAINGGPVVFQRGTSLTVNDADYGPADRWKILTSSGGSTSAQRITGDKQRYALRITQTNATARRLGAVQFVEGVNCRHLRGEQTTLSVRVQCSSSSTVRVGILQWSGTEDSMADDPVSSWAALPTWASNYTLAGSTSLALSANTWTDISVTATLNIGFNNIALIVWTETSLAQNATLDIEGVQHERGSVATPFEVRPEAAELVMCKRYFERLGGNRASEQLGPGFARTTSVFFNFIQYGQKRTTPSVSYTGTFNISTVGVITGSIIDTNDIGPSSFFNQFENVGAFTQGYAGALRTANISSYIDIDAEL